MPPKVKKAFKTDAASSATVVFEVEEVWRQYHDEVERELSPSGAFQEAADFAAKSAENAARLAGCFHALAGGGNSISGDCMRRAAGIAQWYLYEALRVMDAFDEPQAVRDAQLLEDWLKTRGGPVRKSLVQGVGPNPLRDKSRRDAALEVLVQANRARVVPAAGGHVIELNPALTAIANPAKAATP